MDTTSQAVIYIFSFEIDSSTLFSLFWMKISLKTHPCTLAALARRLALTLAPQKIPTIPSVLWLDNLILLSTSLRLAHSVMPVFSRRVHLQNETRLGQIEHYILLLNYVNIRDYQI